MTLKGEPFVTKALQYTKGLIQNCARQPVAIQCLGAAFGQPLQDDVEEESVDTTKQ